MISLATELQTVNRVKLFSKYIINQKALENSLIIASAWSTQNIELQHCLYYSRKSVLHTFTSFVISKTSPVSILSLTANPNFVRYKYDHSQIWAIRRRLSYQYFMIFSWIKSIFRCKNISKNISGDSRNSYKMLVNVAWYMLH